MSAARSLEASYTDAERVLVYAPFGRDATLIATVLGKANIAALPCPDRDRFWWELSRGAALVLIADEALSQDNIRLMTHYVKNQPTWSDLPILIMTTRGESTRASRQRATLLEQLGNVTLLERPLRTETIRSAINSALRARRYQYQIRDHIVEQEQAAQALRESEEKLRLALDAAALAPWRVDLATQIVEGTQALREMYGLSPEAPLTVDQLLARVHPEDRARRQAALEECLRNGAPYRVEYRILHRSGSVRWLVLSGRAQYDRNGKPASLIGVALDITARKHVEESLRESEEQFRTLANAIPNLVWMAHPDGVLFWFNQRWFDYTGTTAEEMKQHGWQYVHDPATLPGVLRTWDQAIRTGKAPSEMVFHLRGVDGTVRPFLTRVEPICDVHGSVVRWFGTCTDIYHQKQTEESLRRVNRELEEFAYVASHDLQEPLRTINIYAQLLTRRHVNPADAEAKQCADFIDSGVRRMEQLIRDLLLYSRAVHRDGMPEKGRADLNRCLAQAMTSLKSRIEETGATINVQTLPTVAADPIQLSNVFQNLLSNALKYKKPDVPPSVNIRAEREKEEWIIALEDNGIGFDPQYSSQIFGLFKRLHSEDYPGTGLGLAICQRILERYGGRIWAESQLGQGSTFRFALPFEETNEEGCTHPSGGGLPSGRFHSAGGTTPAPDST